MSQNRRFHRAAGGAAVVTAVLAGLALGAEAPRSGVVRLRAGDVRTVDAPSSLDGNAFAEKWYVLVLDGPMDPARSAALTGAGVVLGGYLPTNSFIADFSRTTPARVKALPFVVWAAPYRKEWKLDARLAAGANGRPFATAPRQGLAGKGEVAAEVWLFRGEAEGPVRAAIAKLANAQVTSSTVIDGRPVLRVVLRAKDVARLGEMPAVQFAEHAAEFTARSNTTTRWVVQSDVLNMTPVYDHGITGVGQIVGLIDGGLAYQHCSFLDSVNLIGPLHRKIVAAMPTCAPFDPDCQSYSNPFYDFHGTHCGGTLLGDAGFPDDTRGIAYGAKMVFQSFPNNNFQSVYDEFMFAYNHGARVHSNSWGDDSSTTYDGPCSAIDAFQHTHDDNLILFAVTDLNSVVRNPENAKNALAVSASGEAPIEDGVCSAGGHAPTADGRRKPEIMAPGCGITSSTGVNGCGTLALTGTSMACPAVAGAATLIREYFMDGYYPTGQARQDNSFTPSGALLKAMLISSSVDMAGVTGYPSDREGWGRVLLSNVLLFSNVPQHRLLLSDVRNASPQALQTGQSGHLSFYTGNSTAPLHITLAYHDAPAAPNAAAAAINNLDLVVTSPTGQVYHGNNFAGGVSAPGGSADAINNLEQVIVASPAPGHWDVAVVGAAVQEGPQGYAVAVTGAVDQNACASADFNCDGDTGTDADIEAFFAAIAGGFGDADFNRDGDVGTDADIESFFRVLAGGSC